MPSAAKRRKAAKKKKEQEANLDLSISDSLGNEDVKSQDEKGSDGGELTSPSTQDHHNDHTQFDGVEKSDQSPVLQNSADEDSTHAISAAIKHIEHIESAKEPKEGNDGSSSSSSSSSSSEDESHVMDTKSADHNLVSKTNTDDNSSAEVIKTSEIAPVDEKIIGSAQIEDVGNSSLSGDSAAEQTIYIEENKGIESFLSTTNGGTKTSAASNGLMLEESLEKVEEKECEIQPSSSFPSNSAYNGAQHITHDEISEESESQPLVADLAPRMAPRTSIFSCCGLLDALTGSNR